MSATIEPLIAQAEELCGLHDHITRVIARLDIPVGTFSDRYPHPNKATFEFESIIRMFVYQYVRGFTQTELYRRLKGAAYVWIRFELPRTPTQQAISYTWRRRLSLTDRRRITATAQKIRDIANDHDIISDGEPRIDPDNVDNTKITDAHMMDAVETARTRGLDEFDSERASNATFEDLVFFERQAYLNMTVRGMTTRSVGSTQRFERLSDREKTPHPDTRLRTMKKTATPAEQTTLDEYENGRRPTDWQRIRDEVLESFHRGVEVLLEEVRDNSGLREPAIAAIDITPWQVYASPYKDDEEVEHGDESVVVNGEERHPREDYPEMVHGLTRKHERGYAMATITIIGEDTPIVLGIEPVRRASQWVTDVGERTTQADLVEQLLEQATQHVDIHKVFCDGGFDANGVRDAIDRRDMTYLIPKRRYDAEFEDIEELQTEAVTNVGVIRDVPHGYYDRVHTGSIISSHRQKKRTRVPSSPRIVMCRWTWYKDLSGNTPNGGRSKTRTRQSNNTSCRRSLRRTTEYDFCIS